MSGTKGKSGGARPGAGRKPKPKPTPQPLRNEAEDMLDLLQKVALGETDATSLQVRAAIAAVQYTHKKSGDGGIKEEAQKRSETAHIGTAWEDLLPKFEPPARKRSN